MRPKTDWTLFAKSVEHYETLGWEYIETPWIVSEESVKVTWDHYEMCTMPDNRIVVGSAEQAYIELMRRKSIDVHDKQYVAAGPCFRWKDNQQENHQETFFKSELIHINPISPHALERCINDAMMFFRYNTTGKLNVIKTDEGFDINLNGIEIGSYGIRTHGRNSWIYGTGLALPRFSIANNLK